MEDKDPFGGEGEAETNQTILLDDQQDAFLKNSYNIPVGVLSVHVFGCVNLLLEAEPVPEGFQVYGKVIVGSLAKTTSVAVQPKKGKVVWNEIFSFPVSIVTQMKDLSNQVVFSVHCYEGENDSKHKMIGKVSFHLHKLVKIGWSMDKYELKSRKKTKSGVAELEFAFSYGLFGYGFSDQLENIAHSPEEVLRQSMFPRVRPPDDNKFSKWSLLKPQSVPHPNYIPFSETVTDLMPELFQDEENTFVIKIPKARQSLKESMPRLSKLRNEYLGQTGRIERIKFLRKLIHAKESYQGDDESESSEEESTGYIPAGLAAMLSGVARSAIAQTVPGVTVRSRADYKNLKVAVSPESLSDDDQSQKDKNDLQGKPHRNVSTSDGRTTSHMIMKRLAALQETLSPRDAKLANSVTAAPCPAASTGNKGGNRTLEVENIGGNVYEVQSKSKDLSPDDDGN